LNNLINLIRIAKRTYYDTKFEQAKSDLKTTWKLINGVINIRKKKSSYPTSFNINNNMISDPKKIVEEFCQYFTNAGTSSALENEVGNADLNADLSTSNLSTNANLSTKVRILLVLIDVKNSDYRIRFVVQLSEHTSV
jgi:hypothetical protein